VSIIQNEWVPWIIESL
jgi:hypothetical protein